MDVTTEHLNVSNSSVCVKYSCYILFIYFIWILLWCVLPFCCGCLSPHAGVSIPLSCFQVRFCVYTFKVNVHVLNLAVSIKLGPRMIHLKNSRCSGSINNWICMLGLHSNNNNNKMYLCSPFWIAPNYWGNAEKKRFDLWSWSKSEIKKDRNHRKITFCFVSFWVLSWGWFQGQKLTNECLSQTMECFKSNELKP